MRYMRINIRHGVLPIGDAPCQTLVGIWTNYCSRLETHLSQCYQLLIVWVVGQCSVLLQTCLFNPFWQASHETTLSLHPQMFLNGFEFEIDHHINRSQSVSYHGIVFLACETVGSHQPRLLADDGSWWMDISLHPFHNSGFRPFALTFFGLSEGRW